MDHLEIEPTFNPHNGNGNGALKGGLPYSASGARRSPKTATTKYQALLAVAAVAAVVAAAVSIAALARVNTTHSGVVALQGSSNALRQSLDADAGRYHFAVHEQRFPSKTRRPPGFEASSWADVLADAEGKRVRFWMWSGNKNINAWVDDWLAPKVRDYFGVTLERVPQGAPAAVDTVAEEVAAGNTDNGSCDLVWINGVNFANLKKAGHAYGPWADRVPNSQNFDFGSAAIATDKGTPTEGLEMPYNTAQSVFIYNKVHVAQPPKDVPAIVAWAKANPGKFTYSQATDFTGAMVVRTFFYHYAGVNADPAAWSGPLDEAKYAAVAPKVWAALNELEPYLWKDPATGKQAYPASHETVRGLFAKGDVWLEAAYDPNLAAQQILNNKWAEDSAQSYVLSTGNIMNTNYVAIPTNSGSKAAAMVVGNFIAHVEAMFRRTQPDVWGALQSFDPTAPHIANSGWISAFDYIDTHAATPPVTELATHRLPELDQSYVQRIEEDWEKFVKNKV